MLKNVSESCFSDILNLFQIMEANSSSQTCELFNMFAYRVDTKITSLFNVEREFFFEKL